MPRGFRSAFLMFLLLLPLFLASAINAQNLALVGATVYPSPDATPIPDAVVLVSNGVISQLGSRSSTRIPKDAQVIDCKGKFIVAGFWNSHVHFSEAVWNNAGTAPADALGKHMQEMLTRWGFTTVWDLGSEPQNTLSLRRRVDSGEIPGPKILMAGPIFPKGGHPVYLPPEMQLPEAATPEEAAKMTRDYMSLGLDGMKLFTGAYMGDKPVINMDVAIVKAAADIAHAQNKPVFAHPQNKVGVDNAIAGGVDILAHTFLSEPNYTAEELARFKAQHTALIPTLTLWTTVVNDQAVAQRLVRIGVDQLRTFAANGGPVLFGTDVGFVTHYDTALEFEFMSRAISPKEILASLTTNPADYFHAAQKGRVTKGLDADLVVLSADPLADVHNLAKIDYTIRAGKIIYQAPPASR